MAIITVVPANTVCLRDTDSNVSFGTALFAFCAIQVVFFSSCALAQEPAEQQPRGQSFTPAVEVASYAYQIKTPQINGIDKGAALEVIPSLAWRYQGPQLLTRFSAEHQRVWYEDAQRSSFGFTEYNFSNELTAFDRRLVWNVDAGREYIVRGGGLAEGGVFRDKITNSEGLSPTDRMGTSLQLSNARHRKAQFGLSLSAQTIDSKQPENDDLLGNIDNRQYGAIFTTNRNYRYGGLYWRGGANATRTERVGNENLQRDNATLQVGLPLFAGLAWLTKGYYEKNNIQNSNFNNEFSSAGTGLEWYFGQASRINVTYNTVLNDTEQDNYFATSFYLAPTRRTSLEGLWDRRYFGRTAQLSGRYSLRFLSFRLSYTDEINSLSFLEAETNDLGLFVCPDGSVDIGSCVILPRVDYQPLPGQQIFRFTETGNSLRDEVVLNRQGSFTMGYSRNRLNISLELTSSEIRNVESDRVDRRHSVSLANSLRLSELSQLLLNIRALDYSYGITGREDRNWFYELAWNRELSTVSQLSVSALHSNRDSNDSNFEYRENRLSVSYKYQF